MDEQLRDAFLEEDLPRVLRILQQPGFSVNQLDWRGFAALHYAAECNVVFVQAILQIEGVNVNVRTVVGCTALHWAWRTSIENMVPIIQALLDAGADPNAADNFGCPPLFYHASPPWPISIAEALLDGGADPAVRSNDLDTFIHIACHHVRLDIVNLLLRRQGSECLTWKNNREETPLDRLGQGYLTIPIENTNAVRQRILQAYAGMIAHRDGLLCLHSVLQDTTFIDGNDEEFQLPVGKLNTEHLQKLLEYVIAAEPGSVRTLDRDGLMPLQVASQLNFPDLVLNPLLRLYPGVLLLL